MLHSSGPCKCQIYSVVRLQSVHQKVDFTQSFIFYVHSVLIDKSSKLTWTQLNQPDNFTISHQKFILFGADPLDPFVCNICGLSFMKKFLIRSHLMTVHEVWILIILNKENIPFFRESSLDASDVRLSDTQREVEEKTECRLHLYRKSSLSRRNESGFTIIITIMLIFINNTIQIFSLF